MPLMACKICLALIRKKTNDKPHADSHPTQHAAVAVILPQDPWCSSIGPGLCQLNAYSVNKIIAMDGWHHMMTFMWTYELTNIDL